MLDSFRYDSFMGIFLYFHFYVSQWNITEACKCSKKLQEVVSLQWAGIDSVNRYFFTDLLSQSCNKL